MQFLYLKITNKSVLNWKLKKLHKLKITRKQIWRQPRLNLIKLNLTWNIGFLNGRLFDTSTSFDCNGINKYKIVKIILESFSQIIQKIWKIKEEKTNCYIWFFMSTWRIIVWMWRRSLCHFFIVIIIYLSKKKII